MEDYNDLYPIIGEVVAKSPKGHLVNVPKAISYMLAQGESYDVDGVFVSYAITHCWFNNEIVLNELAVIRLRPEGKFTNAIRHLQFHAVANDVDRIAVGTMLASNDRALSVLYKRHGFKLVAHQLSKEIT